MADSSFETVVAGSSSGGTSNIFVKTEELLEYMDTIKSTLAELNTYLETDNLNADSFGSSSFRQSIENVLDNIQISYRNGIGDVINEMLTSLEAVRSQYESRANAIDGIDSTSEANATTGN